MPTRSRTRPLPSPESERFERRLKHLQMISAAAAAIGLIGIIVGFIALSNTASLASTVGNLTSFVSNINTSHISSGPAAARTTLAGIDQPLNATELGVINNAPNSYFELAGEAYLNGSLSNQVGAQATNTTPLIINGRPSVIYLGSITCIFCGENRWAMALALSRFGSFSSLFKGYSSLGDGDVPTLYWRPDNYNATNAITGSYYASNYINFLPIEDTAPITGGFQLQPLPIMQAEVNSTGNSSYIRAMSLIIRLANFQGTPYTIWGRSVVGGADAVDFGNSTPTSQNLPIAQMTHAQILKQFSENNDQFSMTEYAAADLYIAMTCASINNTASACNLPAIRRIELLNKYQ